jgi:RNA polymerase sigma factor (sigma-70 family)
MAPSQSTCWTMIQEAAAGEVQERERFVACYAPLVRAYLAARWGASHYREEIDDAIQEVFVECFRLGGVLQRADAGVGRGFRAFFYGVVRNVALRFEKQAALAHKRNPADTPDPDELVKSERGLSRVFDQAWVTSLLREAAALQTRHAERAGTDALRHVELLRLRFQDDLPIREIARQWGVDAAGVHRQYERARQEFKAALLEVLSFHYPGTQTEIEQRCVSLLAAFD